MKTKLISPLFFLMIFVSFALPNPINADGDFTLSFAKGNDSYIKGDYTQAIIIYKKLLDKVSASDDLYYNLGNAYFKNEMLGEAIYYYKLALELNPRNANILYNLNFARKETKDKIENTAVFKISSLFPFSKTEFHYIFLLLSFIFWGALMLHLYAKKDVYKWARNISLLFIVLLVIPAFKSVFLQAPFGVVTKDNIKVYSGAGAGNVVLFSLQKGSEFDVLSKDNKDWATITLADGKKGMVKQDSIIFNP